MNVEQVMTRDVVTVTPETPLREVARILTERRITGLPVVDANGVVVGVVSGRDLLVKEVAPAARRRRRHGVDPRIEARTAGEAMTSPAVCISAERPLWECAAWMTSHRVHRLPVSNRDGQLIGIVTRADLVRAFARADADVEQELRDELAEEGVDVEVAAGEVTLRGVVGSRAVARELERRAARVAGVGGVTSKLMWPDRVSGPARLLPPT